MTHHDIRVWYIYFLNSKLWIFLYNEIKCCTFECLELQAHLCVQSVQPRLQVWNPICKKKMYFKVCDFFSMNSQNPTHFNSQSKLSTLVFEYTCSFFSKRFHWLELNCGIWVLEFMKLCGEPPLNVKLKIISTGKLQALSRVTK